MTLSLEEQINILQPFANKENFVKFYETKLLNDKERILSIADDYLSNIFSDLVKLFKNSILRNETNDPEYDILKIMSFKFLLDLINEQKSKIRTNEGNK